MLTLSILTFCHNQGGRGRANIQQAQEELERRQREEEDRLLKQMMEERENEKKKMESEVDREWEIRIKDLTEKFDAEMARKGKKDKKVCVCDV